MTYFFLNGDMWRIRYVEPQSSALIDRSGNHTVATTDPAVMCIYVSNRLTGAFLERVLMHELGHCTLFSFGLLDDIHRAVRPEYWVTAEEWICNFIADYGMKILETVHEINYVPYEIDKLLA